MIEYYIIEFEGYEPFSLKTDYERMTKRVISLVEDFSEIDRKYIKSISKVSKVEAMKNPIATVLKKGK
jgi:hypothetical protein